MQTHASGKGDAEARPTLLTEKIAMLLSCARTDDNPIHASGTSGA
jgi:hypothetical protein